MKIFNTSGVMLLEVHGDSLRGADLTGTHLRGAALRGADLRGADLRLANLSWADLRGADLTGANLTGAYLYGADLRAHLYGADLTGAAMPDGRRWEEYSADHLAGICKTPEVRERAIAAWGSHSWSHCPMAAALGVESEADIADEALRLHVGNWVAFYDSGLLQYPVM